MVSLLLTHMIGSRKSAAWLAQSRRNVFSQTGEDGIIEKILSIFPAQDNWCVEFGAWDGLFLSNARNLIENHDYRAVMIEGDPVKFSELKRNYQNNPKVIPLHQMVGFQETDGLDRILSQLSIPVDFDFLSIDIDGNDYHVWKAIRDYRPKLVCIEFNPTIPPNVKFVQTANPNITHGSSLRSLADLAEEKQYELVLALPFNAFFVDRKYFSLFEIENNSPEVLWVDQESVTYLFSGYDGTVFIQGFGKLPWHGIPFEESQLQLLPRFLRKYPGNYSRLQRKLYDWYRKIKGI